MIKINIKSLVGENALSYDKAEILYQELLKNINEKEIELDFSDMSVIASPFFNGSIGLLLKDFDIKKLQEKLKLIGLSENDKNILNVVIKNAISFYKEQKEMIELEKKCQKFIEEVMSFDSAHDLSHIKRVVKSGKEIAEYEKADLNIVVPACWLHDCVNVDKKSKDRNLGSKFSADKAIEFLKSINYPEEYYEEIHHAIHSHSFSANIETKTLAAKIVQDADRMDALGALGISRCLMYSANSKRPLYNESDPFAENRELQDSDNALDHFFTKLITLPNTMKTSKGKMIAQERWNYMEGFINQLKKEIGK